MLVAHRDSPDSMATFYRSSSSHPHGLYVTYPIPAQRGRDENAARKGLTYAEHERLRSRKTPHGRIDERHEAGTLDKNIHIPAAKHVILSVPPQSLNASKNTQEPHFYHRNQLEESVSVVNLATPEWSATQNGLHPARDFIGGLDSVQHQPITAHDQNYYYPPGSHIPTVLPATLHGYLGPTASAGQQYYGPYWPDGTFSPYRPAPTRDLRFFGRIPEPVEDRTELLGRDRTLRHAGRLPLARATLGDFAKQGPPHCDPAQSFLPFYERTLRTSGHRRPSLNMAEDRSLEKFGTMPEAFAAGPHGLDLYSQPLRPGDASDRIAFRDKTFSWAHQMYVELLTRIQHENKPGRPGSNSFSHSKSNSKPAIFPKPPQRSGSYFKDLFTSFPKATGKEHFAGSQARQAQNWGELARPQTAVHVPQGQSSMHNYLTNSNAIVSAPPVYDVFHSLTAGATRRVSDAGIHPANIYQPTGSSFLPAMSALEAMELLCEEADTSWTDGMLLAGCLAYGLGDYVKALGWYQKILAQDPRHVEAMSNVAATLLALGRREEALRNWSAAVSLRPSYFEAVEHLIGLLCAAHKAKDAVEIIRYVESCLKLSSNGDLAVSGDQVSDGESDSKSRSSSITTGASLEHGMFDYDMEQRSGLSLTHTESQAAGFGSSGYAIPGADNGRLLALIHAKGNMLYGLGDNNGAAASFEDAILIATGHRHSGIHGLIKRILHSCVSHVEQNSARVVDDESKETILLSPERAQQTAQRMFPPTGELPGLEFVHRGLAYKAAISTTSNSLLSLAKIYQDGMGNPATQPGKRTNGTREILALYYLSLSLQRSPSTANNVGILLASVQQTANIQVVPQCTNNQIINYNGIAPGSSIALALEYYSYGLNIDPKHAHLYTNLGSLLKDLGQLTPAIRMYEFAVQCDRNFDIALANLANAVKDQGRIADAITYYRRAVSANPEFAEAVCGLATALNSVCNWYGRGGVYADAGQRDPIHVDENGNMQKAQKGYGWMNRVVEIVDKQLREGESWGTGILTSDTIDHMCQQLMASKSHLSSDLQKQFSDRLRKSLKDWSGNRWEGARTVRLVERAIKVIGWQWYQDRYKLGEERSTRRYARPYLPALLSTPTAPTVLPFHTFTTPLSAKQVRQISQRNALRISVAALRSPWLPHTVYPPPAPPAPCLNVGYVSSDLNNHPLAHLMQSVFGLHRRPRVQAFCYATTASDGSVHRQQIEREAPFFYDASTWSVERLVDQIVRDGIHILVNLNGYTRGAKNEVFAARPAPIHMSFMGFAGTLGAEWCDYVFADPISVLPKTLSPWRRNVDIEDRLHPDSLVEDEEGWMYSENVIFAKSTFFCVDHKQSAPDAGTAPPPRHDRMSRNQAWDNELDKRWRLRKELFPMLSDSAIILGNFNQLYKIDPSTFRMYLRILAAVPNAILWLLRFPDVGEQYLKGFAREWAGNDVASRLIFTDVAPKSAHITRASVVDLFLDTPECNAHTTAADVLWSGTPIVTWARWEYKMCSRMASSIVASALPEGPAGDEARADLLVESEEHYVQQACRLALGLRYPEGGSLTGKGRGRLMDLRRMLWEGRWTSRLFDTRRWVNDLENVYWEAWRKWESGEGGDIWL